MANFVLWGQEQFNFCHWLQLRAANGFSIPYVGYLELDVELCAGCGVLVVRDPPAGVRAEVPRVLGIKILSRCYQGLFGQHGVAFFDLPVVLKAPSSVFQALQYCKQVKSQAVSDSEGQVKVRGHRVWRILGSTLKWVAATCSAQYSGGTVLFETNSGAVSFSCTFKGGRWYSLCAYSEC